MQDRLNIAVFVDYDNIEIGVKSTLRREFDVSLPLGASKSAAISSPSSPMRIGAGRKARRARWRRTPYRWCSGFPRPRGDKNGADINLALDALEMAFTHAHVNAFAIVSGDSDFIPLVNKLKEYGKTVFVVGGKAFTSTILQQNCHEFVSYESLLEDGDRIVATAHARPAQIATATAMTGGDRKDKEGPRPAARSARTCAGHAAGRARPASVGAPRRPTAAGTFEIAPCCNSIRPSANAPMAPAVSPTLSRN